VAQLKWQLIGLFCAVLFLLWIAYRLIGKLFNRRSSLAAARHSRG
jgi:hypothetical protein